MAQALKIQQEHVVSQFASQSSEASEEDASNSPMLAQALDAVFNADDRGIRLQIEVNDEPSSYDAIMKLRDGFRSFGLSTQLTDELIDAIDSEMTNTSADAAINEGLSRFKKLTLMVSDTPPAVDDDKFTFMRAWDRNKRHGAGYSSQQMHLTNRGTKTTTTNMPDLENLFTGNGERYLILCIEAFKADELDGLDEVGMGLAALAVAAGPGVPAAELKEIRAAIEQKKIAPEQTALIKNLANLNRVVETVVRSPESINSAPQAMKSAREAVTQTLQAVTTSGTLSPALLNSTITAFQRSEVALAPQVSRPSVVIAQPTTQIAAPKANNNNTPSVVAGKTHAPAPQAKAAEVSNKANASVIKTVEPRKEQAVARPTAVVLKPQAVLAQSRAESAAPVVQKMPVANKPQVIQVIKEAAPAKPVSQPAAVKPPVIVKPVVEAKAAIVKPVIVQKPAQKIPVVVPPKPILQAPAKPQAINKPPVVATNIVAPAPKVLPNVVAKTPDATALPPAPPVKPVPTKPDVQPPSPPIPTKNDGGGAAPGPTPFREPHVPSRDKDVQSTPQPRERERIISGGGGGGPGYRDTTSFVRETPRHEAPRDFAPTRTADFSISGSTIAQDRPTRMESMVFEKPADMRIPSPQKLTPRFKSACTGKKASCPEGCNGTACGMTMDFM